MALESGNVIEFDYELWVEGRPGLVDTTLRDAAEKAGVRDPQAHYGPVATILGAGRILSGLERALLEATVGQTVEVGLAPADAYGDRDPKRVETVPLSEFRRNEVAPQAGMAIRYKNRRGVVSTVGGGRVRIDFNPPLAGKRLRYRFTVRRVAANDSERAQLILRMNVPLPQPWKVAIETAPGRATATVEVPPEIVYQPEWLSVKLRLLGDLGRYTKLKEVRLVETYPLSPESPDDEESGAVAPDPLPAAEGS